MSLTDAAVIVPGTGHVWLAPVGTPKPTLPHAPAWPWQDAGHTSVGDGLTISKDGGDSNILGTWQNPSLRNRIDPIVYSLTIHFHQVDNAVLGMYFGGGVSTVDDVFGVNLVPVSQERSIYVQIVDGSTEVDLYIPKVSLIADDDIEVDVENLLSFPVRATVLGVTGSNLMEWLGTSVGSFSNEVQTVTITGTPTGGSFTLTLAGETTGSINYNAAGSAVASALAALNEVGGSGNVSVTGGPGPGTPWVVTFQGSLAGSNIPQMTATSSLTGGTTPAIAVTTGTQGGA